ncbi:MAG: pyridoxal phosphate-dependent aminotransferase [Phycisphaerales bacterium]|nr:pyridoxal phosphate-dependent aminotransferase [Phycisphaerales bacterium]
MPMHLSARVSRLKPSSTLAAAAAAGEMARRGIDIISFGAGEPDFTTPAHIRDAAKDALDAGHTHYSPIAGEPAAREAVARKLQRDNQLGHVTAENVLISAGGKHSFFLLVHALFDPNGDLEMILPTPAWVSYRPIAEMAGARIVEVPTRVEGDFKMTPGQLRSALSPRTRLLLINSPSNPCGTMYSPDELRALAAVVAEHNAAGGRVIVASDDIYEKIVYADTPFATIGRFLDPKCSITLNGLSKAYAMTGWRIGYAAGPLELIRAMTRLQGQMITCIAAFCFPAIVEALDRGDADIAEMREHYRRRAALMHERISALPGVRCPRPTGAFYLFPDVSAWFGRTTAGGASIRSSLDLATALLNEAHVAVVPGDEFGGCGPNHIRLSFACSTDRIQEGMDRIARFIDRLH